MRKLFILAFCLLLAWPAVSLAEAVGRLTQVEGRVELLKGGKLPATEVKAQDTVEPGDVIRTKSLSKAQITFLDNTTVTISPEARIAIEEYMFDPAKSKRSAVLQLFQGLAHFVVSQVYKVQEPDFIVKTHTAAMGVRGTDVGIRISPNDTTFLNFEGLVRVANIFPEVGGTFKRAEKSAFAFGSASVDLKTMQGTVVARNLPPTLPFTITDQDRQTFMGQLVHGALGRRPTGGIPGDTSQGLAANLPNAVSPVVTNRFNTIMNNLTITPRLANVTPASTIVAPALVTAAASTVTPVVTPTQNITFSQSFAGGGGSLISSAITTFQGSFSTISRTVAFPGTFTNNLLNLTITPTGGTFGTNFGSLNVTNNSFTVAPSTGGNLIGTGSMQVSAVSSLGGTFANLNLTGPVNIAPTGAMTFTPGTGSTITSGAATGTVAGTLTSNSGTGTGSIGISPGIGALTTSGTSGSATTPTSAPATGSTGSTGTSPGVAAATTSGASGTGTAAGVVQPAR